MQTCGQSRIFTKPLQTHEINSYLQGLSPRVINQRCIAINFTAIYFTSLITIYITIDQAIQINIIAIFQVYEIYFAII